MSSQPFLNEKSHLFVSTPVLLDGIVLRCRLAAGLPGDPEPPSKRKFYGPKEYAPYFACPYVYPIYRGGPYLKVFGRHTMRTNGCRIFRAATGNPNPHVTGNAQSVEKAEAKNQLEVFEIKSLLKLAERDGQTPMQWLVANLFEAVQAVRTSVINDQGIEAFNPPELTRQQVVAERVEVYLEVQTLVDFKDLTTALQRELYRYIASCTKRRSKIEKSHDQEDDTCYMAWYVPQRKVDRAFSGQKDFKFKVYKKGERLRIEFQANFPKLESPAVWDGQSHPLIPVFMDIVKTANIMAAVLQKVLLAAIDRIAEPSLVDRTAVLIRRRLEELLPVKSKHISMENVVRHLAEHLGITLPDLTKLGWSKNDLKMMAHPEYGFLEKKPLGFDEGNLGVKKSTKRMVRGIYIVNVQKLGQTGRPARHKVVPSRLAAINDSARRQRRMTGYDVVSAATGSAIYGTGLLNRLIGF